MTEPGGVWCGVGSGCYGCQSAGVIVCTRACLHGCVQLLYARGTAVMLGCVWESVVGWTEAAVHVCYLTVCHMRTACAVFVGVPVVHAGCFSVCGDACSHHAAEAGHSFP